MQGFLPLFRQFIGRSLLREKARSLLAVFGIALGVAVMTAVRLANVSIVDSFRAATDAVSGQADLRITSTNGFFDEGLIAKLTWLEQFGQISPVIENYAMVVSPETAANPAENARPLDRGELLYVLGVDVLRDSPLRKYRVLELESAGKKSSPRKLLDLLIADDGVVLTERFANRTGLKTGESIRLAFGSEVKRLRIRGLLKNDGPARTMQGNFALMDIAAAQWASNRLGRLDYLDVELAPGRSLQESAAEIRRGLPPGLIVEPPATQMSRTETMISAPPYLDSIRVVAQQHDVPLFDRFAIMRHWNDAGDFDLFSTVHGPDMAKRVHACLGRALSKFVLDAARLDQAQQN
jgi:ABC-type lipoprotein release transport system permease subunit